VAKQKAGLFAVSLQFAESKETAEASGFVRCGYDTIDQVGCPHVGPRRELTSDSMGQIQDFWLLDGGAKTEVHLAIAVEPSALFRSRIKER
jgi:hypothetical protein